MDLPPRMPSISPPLTRCWPPINTHCAMFPPHHGSWPISGSTPGNIFLPPNTCISYQVRRIVVRPTCSCIKEAIHQHTSLSSPSPTQLPWNAGVTLLVTVSLKYGLPSSHSHLYFKINDDQTHRVGIRALTPSFFFVYLIPTSLCCVSGFLCLVACARYVD